MHNNRRNDLDREKENLMCSAISGFSNMPSHIIIIIDVFFQSWDYLSFCLSDTEVWNVFAFLSNIKCFHSLKKLHLWFFAVIKRHNLAFNQSNRQYPPNIFHSYRVDPKGYCPGCNFPTLRVCIVPRNFGGFAICKKPSTISVVLLNSSFFSSVDWKYIRKKREMGHRKLRPTR